MKSKILVNGHLIEAITFSGGERHLSVPLAGPQTATVEAHLWDSNAIMDLLLVADSLKRQRINISRLIIPYLPYARQDRVCNDYEPHSLAVMAGLINSIEADTVQIWDAHSSVTEALINNYQSVDVRDILAGLAGDYDVLIAPDAGAEKKVGALGKAVGVPVEVARKVRDTLTGNIIKTTINCENDLNGKRVLVVDDICDGGRTFIELAKVLNRTFNMERLDLYVTHGIMSQGTSALGEQFHRIYSVNQDLKLEQH